MEGAIDFEKKGKVSERGISLKLGCWGRTLNPLGEDQFVF